MNKYRKQTCNNCGMCGHLFYNCKKPIMSFGIICYRIIDNEIQYLMIRRKDSLGYVDFLRGKYNQNNDFHLRNIIKEMTVTEIENIKNYQYSELWDKLWNKKNEKYDRKNYEKFNYVKNNKIELFDDNNNNWCEPEWGFPKGRRNNRENDFDCSMREFEEETGFSRNNLIILKNIGYFEETFTGSNLKSYKHKYYLCKINPENSYNKNYQKSEIGDMKWFNYDECMEKIRNYNIEKKNMLIKINTILNNRHIV
jgi:hypothetical protein